MEKFSDVVTIIGPPGLIPIVGANVTVWNYGTSTSASIYSSNSTNSPAANPLTTDSSGRFGFYAADGRYSLQMSGNSIQTTVLSDIELFDSSSSTGLTIQNLHGISLQTQGTPYSLYTASGTFNGQRDDLCTWGYNVTVGAVPGGASSKVTASEPQVFLDWESHYFDGVTHYMELNLDYLSSDNLTAKRFLAFNVNRTTHVGQWALAASDFTVYGSSVNVGPQFQVTATASAVNYIQVSGSTLGNGPILGVVGTDTNIVVQYVSKGTGGHFFETAGGTIQAAVLHTASATNYLTFTGSNGGNPTLSVSAGNLAITPLAAFGSSITVAGEASVFGATGTDAANKVLIRGTAQGLRLGTSSGAALVEGVDNTGTGSYQPILITGTTVGLRISGTTKFSVDASGNTAFVGSATVGTGFGCNTKAAQTAFASGGALNAYGAGANGLDSGANMSALHALVVAIRAALVANGIMS